MNEMKVGKFLCILCLGNIVCVPERMWCGEYSSNVVNTVNFSCLLIFKV